MPDITDVDPSCLREMSRILGAEARVLDALTPAGALTTISAALRGSLIEVTHGEVSLDILDFQQRIDAHIDSEIRALRDAAELIESTEHNNAAALCIEEAPR